MDYCDSAAAAELSHQNTIATERCGGALRTATVATRAATRLTFAVEDYVVLRIASAASNALFAAVMIEQQVRVARGTGSFRRLDLTDQDGVAQIVHDLKSPLSTIALEVAVLEATLGPELAAATAHVLQRITRNVEFMDRLIHDLLDLSAIDAGRFELQRKATDLRELVIGVLDRCVPTRERERLIVHADTPLELAVDDLRIERVIANLVHNALKYAPPATGVVVRLDRRRDDACLSVIDAGPGLTAAEASTVFEKHRRGSAALGDGAGLGLYVSKRIVEAHGGRIGVDSQPGLGSRFFVELPLLA